MALAFRRPRRAKSFRCSCELLEPGSGARKATVRCPFSEIRAGRRICIKVSRCFALQTLASSWRLCSGTLPCYNILRLQNSARQDVFPSMDHDGSKRSPWACLVNSWRSMVRVEVPEGSANTTTTKIHKSTIPTPRARLSSTSMLAILTVQPREARHQSFSPLLRTQKKIRETCNNPDSIFEPIGLGLCGVSFVSPRCSVPPALGQLLGVFGDTVGGSSGSKGFQGSEYTAVDSC